MCVVFGVGDKTNRRPGWFVACGQSYLLLELRENFDCSDFRSRDKRVLLDFGPMDGQTAERISSLSLQSGGGKVRDPPLQTTGARARGSKSIVHKLLAL